MGGPLLGRGLARWGLLLGLVCIPRGEAAEGRRPNFIFLYADDQRWDALGVVQREEGAAARFPWLETPNLDRLSREGLRFRNAFVVHSLCTPSRASYLTGQYTHTHRVGGNFTALPEEAIHHGKALAAAGYVTAYIGKWHMGTEGGKRPGFAHSASYRGQGMYFDCAFDVDGVERRTKGWVDDVATDFAIEFIKRERARPFSVVVGYKSPHHAFQPPERLRRKFEGESLGAAPNWANPAIYLGRVQRVTTDDIKPGGNRRVEDPLDYFRTIAGLDENVGRILALLDELGIAEDTMVIYSSDNGYHLGDHGIGDERSAYEESMRVPLLVRYPRLAATRGRMVDGMVLNIDLAPTLVDFAGAAPLPAVQGRSWRPLAEGRAERVREQFLYECFFLPRHRRLRAADGESTDHADDRRFADGNGEADHVSGTRVGGAVRPAGGSARAKESRRGPAAGQSPTRDGAAVENGNGGGELCGAAGGHGRAGRAERWCEMRKVWRRWIAVAAVWAMTAGAIAAAPPNVLLIVADDLGYSDLGCFGGEIRTPHLDRVAAEGVRFTQFYNNARCVPSRASLLTGLYAHQVALGHVIRDHGLPGYRGRVARHSVTLADVLRGAGYRTFMAGKWHLGTDDPTAHGFEEFYGTLISSHTFWDPDHYTRLPRGRERRKYGGGEFYGTDAMADYALDFLAQARTTPDKPWFLYLAFNAPHFPLHAPAADIERYAGVYWKGWDAIREERLTRLKELGLVDRATELPPRSEYWTYDHAEDGVNPAWETLPADRRADLARRMATFAAMVDRMDEAIGRVLADIRARGEEENTLVIFTSDNGACAEWDPHGFDIKSGPQNILHRGTDLERMGGPGTYHSVGSAWANASNTPWRLYKHFAHEGGIASPCIVRWPTGIKRRGAIETRPAHLIDVMPTLIEAAGASYPRTHDGERTLPPEGRSLLPVLRGEASVGERSLFFEHEGNRAVRDGEWKLVALKDGPWELYHLGSDRTEMRNRATAEPERVRAMGASWGEWARRCLVLPAPKDFKSSAGTTPPATGAGR